MATPGLVTKPSTYVPYPLPTVGSWLGHFVDKQTGGEVDLTIERKSGDTVTFTLNDKGRPAEEHRNVLSLPLSSLALDQDVDLSNAKSHLFETLIVKNTVELQDGVVLTLQKAEGGNLGPATKVLYSRPSPLPGKMVSFELSPWMSPPR